MNRFGSLPSVANVNDVLELLGKRLFDASDCLAINSHPASPPAECLGQSIAVHVLVNGSVGCTIAVTDPE
jgi:hypothetical protein